MQARHLACDAPVTIRDATEKYKAATGDTVDFVVTCTECDDSFRIEFSSRWSAFRCNLRDAVAFDDKHSNKLLTFRCQHCHNRRLEINEYSLNDDFLDLAFDCSECDAFDGGASVELHRFDVSPISDAIVDTQGTYSLSNESGR